MRQFFLTLVVAASLLPAPIQAEPSKDQLTAIREAEGRGAELYAYDQAAWHSTDRFQADLKKRAWSLGDVGKKGLAGYIVEPAQGNVLLVTYFGVQKGKAFAMARYWIRDGKLEHGGILADGDDAALSSLAQKLVKARDAVLHMAPEQRPLRCTTGNFNTVVLPPRADGSIPVYLLSSQVESGIYPAGGHHRYVVGENGEIVSSRAFSKGCIDIGSSDAAKRPTGFVLSHGLDPQPTEMHVFLNWVTQIPLAIITVGNRDVWGVNKGKVSWLKTANEANN